MKQAEAHSQRAQTQSRAARGPNNASKRRSERRRRAESELNHLIQRLALSPLESSVVIGKSETYIYRRIYAGDIKPISGFGRLMIPRSEIDRFLATAAAYNPKRKAEKAKGEEVPNVAT